MSGGVGPVKRVLIPISLSELLLIARLPEET